MKKNIKRIISWVSLFIVFLSILATAYASSYTTSYQFSVLVTWWIRYFNWTNISFTSPSATSSHFKRPSNKTYSVDLYRDKIIDDFIGNVTLYRDSSWVAKWSNVWVWNYYFFLNKANDWVTLTDNTVTIKNY